MCEVCNGDIVAEFIKTPHGKNRHKSLLYSEQGVMFENNWFCNDCWNKIIKFYKDEHGAS